MTVGDVDGDNELEIIAGGWWCPVKAYELDGTVIWSQTYAGGTADRSVMFIPDYNGQGTAAVAVFCAAYSDTTTYLHLTYAENGTIIHSTPFTDSTGPRSFQIANIDLDSNLEMILSSFNEDPTTPYKIVDLSTGVTEMSNTTTHRTLRQRLLGIPLAVIGYQPRRARGFGPS